jgi:D-glycero-D-manno-heptose 1,7-bisphosphate phosphatase
MNDEFRCCGAHIDDFVYCPYHPEAKVEAYRRVSPMRKPEPGMLLELMARFDIDPAQAVMIGDRETDIAAARAAGISGLRYQGGDLGSLVEGLLRQMGQGSQRDIL